MTILNCCVIDDEPLAAQLIGSYVDKTPFMELAGIFQSAQEAIKIILEGKIDVVFLDIQMPQLNGMEFAKIIPPHCRIIFTTAYNGYAVDAFKVNALDYLLKPVSYEDFAMAANRALEWVSLNRQANEKSGTGEYIMVKSEYKLIQIATSDILYIEGLKDYVKIYIDGDRKCIMTLMSMKVLERALPQSRFLRVHRSFIVNTSKIKVIERNRIVFGNNYIPVSDSYKNSFSEFVASRSLLPAPDNDPE
ncbi:MAG: LytTR family DNA-binding domain-containing protein [Muribaculaceae bacterium]|nr:LytTR family DNA-binding domain-containing protein [Muribaculaceae bacterium]